MTNIDALEKQLTKELQEYLIDPMYDDLAEQIIFDGALHNPSQLAQIFDDAAGDKQEALANMHAAAEIAKQIYDVKGDACTPEVKDFINALKTMSREEYNNPSIFVTKTVIKERLNNLLVRNPFE